MVIGGLAAGAGAAAAVWTGAGALMAFPPAAWHPARNPLSHCNWPADRPGRMRFSPAICSGVKGALSGIGVIAKSYLSSPEAAASKTLAKRVIQVLQQVFESLQTDRQTDQTVADAGLTPLFRGHPPVTRHRWTRGCRFQAAETDRVRDQLDAIKKTLRCFFTFREFK